MREDTFANDYRSGVANVLRSAVRHLNAGAVDMRQSAVQKLSADSVQARESALGVVNTSTAELHESSAGVIAADYARVEDSRVLVLLAPRVSGNVKAYVTLPAAFAFGAGYFFARRLTLAIFGRSKS